jgi:catechol 2,3-dioxygenase-like lactoylglutathione lyase family enzyme
VTLPADEHRLSPVSGSSGWRSQCKYFGSQGVRIVKGVRDADYGMRTFVFADPDGNRIDVGEDL